MRSTVPFSRLILAVAFLSAGMTRADERAIMMRLGRTFELDFRTLYVSGTECEVRTPGPNGFVGNTLFQGCGTPGSTQILNGTVVETVTVSDTINGRHESNPDFVATACAEKQARLIADALATDDIDPSELKKVRVRLIDARQISTEQYVDHDGEIQGGGGPWISFDEGAMYVDAFLSWSGKLVPECETIDIEAIREPLHGVRPLTPPTETISGAFILNPGLGRVLREAARTLKALHAPPRSQVMGRADTRTEVKVAVEPEAETPPIRKVHAHRGH